MSIEGMWCLVSGDVFETSVASGGVVVLDTQRLYGGDSVMAYIGRYETSGGRVIGEAETFRYNLAVDGIDVFGQPMGETRRTEFDVHLTDNGLLEGVLRRGEVELPIILKKLRDLP